MPSVEQYLAKLEADPAAAAAFDAATRREMPQAASRREAVAATLEAIKAAQNELKATREKLIAAKNRLAALEVAKAKNERLRAELAATRARLAAKRCRPASKPAPASGTVYEKYVALKKTDPQAATKFFIKNRKSIYTEADRAKGRR